MSTLRVTEIQSNSTSYNTPVRFETSGGTENGRLIKAWVTFNGQGTVAIRADFNVNTVGDNGTSKYQINFSNALSNGNYSCWADPGQTDDQYGYKLAHQRLSTPSSTSFQMMTNDTNFGHIECPFVHVAVTQ